MSTLRCETIQDPNGVERYLARAWVNFNGTGTVAIRAAGNVMSITDNGVGDYTVNFTNAMPDANYCPVLSTVQPSGGTTSTRVALVHGTDAVGATTKTTTALRIINGGTASNILQDSAEINVAIFR